MIRRDNRSVLHACHEGAPKVFQKVMRYGKARVAGDGEWMVSPGETTTGFIASAFESLPNALKDDKPVLFV